MILPTLFLIIGLFLIIYGADYFVASSSLLAKRFGIPKLIIGLTIIALGTSAPEFGVNMIASIGGHSDIALGNILGSNISNFLLVFAGTALFVKKISISKNSLTQISVAVLVSLVTLAFGMLSFGGDAKSFIKIEGLILLLAGFFYWFYLYKITKENTERLEDDDIVDNPLTNISSNIILFGIIIISLVVLLLGSNLVTNNAVLIARYFSISELIIAGTIISIGTSLPEIVTTIQAVKQKQYNLMIGNIVGSNIINTLFILGTSILIRQIPVSAEAIPYLHMNAVASVILLIGFTIFAPRVFRPWQGFVLIALYWIFIIWTLF